MKTTAVGYAPGRTLISYLPLASTPKGVMLMVVSRRTSNKEQLTLLPSMLLGIGVGKVGRMFKWRSVLSDFNKISLVFNEKEDSEAVRKFKALEIRVDIGKYGDYPIIAAIREYELFKNIDASSNIDVYIRGSMESSITAVRMDINDNRSIEDLLTEAGDKGGFVANTMTVVVMDKSFVTTNMAKLKSIE